MHIVLASVSSATAPSGVCRHAANLALGLQELPGITRVTLLTGEWQVGYFKDAFGLGGERLDVRPVPMANTSRARNLWSLFRLPGSVRDLGADLLHLAYPMPMLPFAVDVPVVLSLHDLYPIDIPDNFGPKRAWLNRGALKLGLRAADAVVCVSEATRARLQQVYPATANSRSFTVLNSVTTWDQAGPLPPQLAGTPFVLCVAQHRANKNLLLLLRGYEAALRSGAVPEGTKLVIVGNDGPETGRLLRQIEHQCLGPHVVLLRGLTDATLAALYDACLLVVAPSLLEGFGLPIAEALAHGCRTVCSEIGAFRALGSDRCTFFSVHDDTGFALAEGMRQAMSQAPPGPWPGFLTPVEAAERYLSIYTRLLAGRKSHQPALVRHERQPAELGGLPPSA